MKQKISPYGRILPWIVLISSYLITRLPNLTKLPIFTDEAIYIRWSQIGASDASWRFISLTDGKQPLFTWIMMVLFKLIHTDPLFTGRLVSVLAGLATLIGLWLLTDKLFHQKRTSFITSLIYVFNPFPLFYDRMALYDSLVAALSVWNLYIAVCLVQVPALDKALIFGATLGLGMLNKSSGLFSLILTPLTPVVSGWRRNDWKSKCTRWILLVILAAGLSVIYYSILRLSPLFNMIGLKNNVFIFSISEWMNQPFRFFIGNIRGLSDWLVSYLTFPVVLLIFFPLLLFWKFPRQKILLVLWWIIPFSGLALFGKVLYPRFILFMVMPLLVLAALTVDMVLSFFKNKSASVFLILIIFFQALNISYFIVMDPVHAPIPLADRGQMMDDWPAGGGIREINQYLSRQAQSKRIVVYTDGTFGLLPYAVEIYLVDNPNVEIHGIWPFPDKIPAEILDKAGNSDVYVITNQYQEKPAWPVELIASYQKGKRPDRFLRLYKIVLPIAGFTSIQP
jgi:hypothetical protein